jgi:predicted nucleotidyltransferase
MNPKIPHSFHKKDLLLKYQKQKQKQQQLQDNALDEAKRLARILVEEFDVNKVYLFGPLSYGAFREGMNIDLAVENISSDMFASALGYLKQISKFGVELTDIQQAEGWTKRSILQKGKLLAEQKKTSTH